MEGSGCGSYIMTDPNGPKHTDPDTQYCSKIYFFHKNAYIICQQQAFLDINVSSETPHLNFIT
jgi:hypothetical protein